jgi:dolichyl-phosphate-mannose--protein O-mannosyl transferase
MWHFHVTLDKPHPYQSSAWGWLFLARPVLYYSGYPVHGELGCTVDKCARMIYDLGTPAIWWASVPVIIVMIWMWVSRRDWRAMALLGGIAAALVPWLATPDRTMFLFYALPALPFIALAITMTIGLVLGPSEATLTRRRWGAIAAGLYLLIVVVMFFYFLPIYTAHTLPYYDWLDGRAWFPSWV